MAASGNAARSGGGPRSIARVVVDVDPAHLDRPFDYRIPDGVEVDTGSRVKVTFHGRRRQAWVLDRVAETDVAPERLRELAPWGGPALFDADDLRLFSWVGRRYASPLAHVLRHALPKRVAAVEREIERWGTPPEDPVVPRQGGAADDWDGYDAHELGAAVDALGDGSTPPAFWLRGLPGDDADARIVRLAARVVARGLGVLVVAPDPRSPLVAAVVEAFGQGLVADHRSARADRTRYRAFLRGRLGHVRVAVGERSGVFAPVGSLGLIVVDDEANPAWKEMRSPRHHVREVALARARMAGALCVLRGDLPSARLWGLLGEGHVRRVTPDRARERAARPRVDVVDLGSPRPGVRRARLSPLANGSIADVVADDGVAIVLAARGGIGAALACTSCGQRRECPVCAGSVRPDAGPGGAVGAGLGSGALPPAGQSSSGAGRPSVGPTSGAGRSSVGRSSSGAGRPGTRPRAGAGVGWSCGQCGWSGPPFPCVICDAERVAPLAAGAARLAEELGRAHPRAQVVRMEGFDATGPDRRPAIAVMTRGSVLDDPGWLAGRAADVVVAPDADGMFARPAVDAPEDTLRLWFSVARMAGRMVLQTREPGDPAVQALVRWDPDGFWEAEAPRRTAFGFPPAAALVRVWIDPPSPGALPDAGGVADVGATLRGALPDDEVLGPTAEGAFMVRTRDLRRTTEIVYGLRQSWDRDGRGVRVDVDPVTDW